MSPWSPWYHDSATACRALIPCLFSTLCTLVYKHFREVPSCANFSETVWKWSPSLCLVGTSLFMCICLEWSSISPVLLITKSLLFMWPHTFCLPTQSSTSSHDCWSSSSSHFVHPFKHFSPVWPACWQRCFFSTWSGGCQLFQENFYFWKEWSKAKNTPGSKNNCLPKRDRFLS